MIRIGIVGCGRILAAHLRGYQVLREHGIDDFRITALCARREGDAHSYIQRGQGPPQRPAVSQIPGDPLAVGDIYLSDFQADTPVEVFTDYQQMIAQGPIDAVNDFTTHALHHQVAAASFASGKHLLTQKPLAISVAAARQMCDQAEAADVAFGVFENARNRPNTRHLEWLFGSGTGGQLQMLLIGSIGAWWAPDLIVAETPWRHLRQEAGGITLDIGVHQANMIRYLAGEITSIQGRTAVIEPQRVTRGPQHEVTNRIRCDAEDTYFASFQTDRGVVGNIAASWAGHGEKTLLGAGTVAYGSAGRATGDEVTLDNQPTQSLSELYAAQADPQQQARHFPKGITDQFALNQLDWLASIRDRRQPETSGREGLQDLAVAFAVLESSLAARNVTVEEVAQGELRAFQRPLDQRYGFV